MPKLPKQEKVILENIPVESIQWIKQPWNLTWIKGDMTVQQLNIYIEMVESLQERMNMVLNKTKQSLFEESEFDADGNISISVPMSNITDYSANYKQVALAASHLFNIMQVIQYTDEHGVVHDKLSHLFQSVDIPRAANSTRRRGDIVFTINKSMIQQVFSLEHYTQFIKGIAKSFKSQYTGRLYMYMEAYKNIGKWTVEYESLREMLGCKIWNDSTKTWEDKRFSKYRNFKDKVLDVAEKELRELASTGQVDCYFEYTAIKEAGRNLLDGPKSIEFRIFITKFGEQQKLEIENKSKFYHFESILRNDLGLKTSAVTVIMNLATAENIDILIQKIEETKFYIVTHQEEIKDKKKYIYTILKNTISDLNEDEFIDRKTDENVELGEGSEEQKNEESVIVMNECTDAIMWLLKARSPRGNVLPDYANNIIEGLNIRLRNDLPEFDKAKNLLPVMKEYYTYHGKDYVYPDAIFNYIKEWQNKNVSNTVSDNVSEVKEPSLFARPVISSDDRNMFEQFRKQAAKIDKFDIFVSDPSSFDIWNIDRVGEGCKLQVAVPNKFCKQQWEERIDTLKSMLNDVYGCNVELTVMEQKITD